MRPESASDAVSDARARTARASAWTSGSSHYWWAKSPADPPIRVAPTTTPLRTSSTATPLGLASKDAPRYGAYSRASYPPQTPAATAGSGTAWSPDALLRRPTEPDAVYKDHSHVMKSIHMAPSNYNDAMVKEKGVARCANARANKVNGQYLTNQDADNAERVPACRPSVGHSVPQCRPVPAYGRALRAHCRPSAGNGHGVPGRRPALACTGARSARPRAGTPVPVRHCLHLGW